MQDLDKALAKLYTSIELSKPVVARAGVDLGLVSFHKQANTNWFNILTVAENSDRTLAIIDAALDDFPNNRELLEAKRLIPVSSSGLESRNIVRHKSIWLRRILPIVVITAVVGLIILAVVKVRSSYYYKMPQMVAIPKGQYTQGSTKEHLGTADEKPPRIVSIDDFRISKTEITFRQFEEYINSVEEGVEKSNVIDDGWGRGKRPVINVDWFVASDYARWLSDSLEGYSCRLPTESEWEYAARAGTESAYIWGDLGLATDHAVFTENNDGGKTSEVMSKQPNAFGLYDMIGNVAEWTQDCYHTYTDAPVDGSINGLQKTCPTRVFRGGSFDDIIDHLRVASRSKIAPSTIAPWLGFRVVCIAD